MKTKNFLLTGALLIMALFSVNGVMAAEPTNYLPGQTSDKVTVNLIFKPIQSIQVNPDQKEINFEYSTPQHYMNGLGEEKTQTFDDHLTVYHSGGFQVEVQSSGFLNSGNLLDETADHVTITATNGTGNNRSNYIFVNNFSLNEKEPSTFITSPGGGMGLKFNVTYEHVGWKSEDTYINFTDGKTSTTYTADVTYTIVSQ
jgi:hypothetical protein